MGDDRSFADAFARFDALIQRERQERWNAIKARYRQCIIDAAGIDPATLSDQGQRSLAWLAEWDDWTTGGIVEILTATRTAALAAGRHNHPANQPIRLGPGTRPGPRQHATTRRVVVPADEHAGDSAATAGPTTPPVGPVLPTLAGVPAR